MSEQLDPNRSIGSSILRELEERTHDSYSLWLPNHARDRLKPIDYDPDNPFHRLDLVHIPPDKPSIELARNAGGELIGKNAFEQLVKEVSDHPTFFKMREGLDRKQSSLVVSIHIENVLDTPELLAAFLCALGDEKYADRQTLISNGLMGRLEIYGENVLEFLSHFGHVLLQPPGGDSARRVGLPQEAVDLVEGPFKKALADRLRKGTITHWALSGSVAKLIQDDDGSTSRVIPRVRKEITEIISHHSRFPQKLFIPMRLKPNPAQKDKTIWKIIDPAETHIVSPDDVHNAMSIAAKYATDFKDGKVIYSEPNQYTATDIGSTALSA